MEAVAPNTILLLLLVRRQLSRRECFIKRSRVMAAKKPITCSFGSVVGTPCDLDCKDRTGSFAIIPLLNCARDITYHKSEFSFSGTENEVDLILTRCGIFEPPRNIDTWNICPFHRASLGVSWNRRSAKCVIPVLLSHHSIIVSSRPKAERGLSKDGSRDVFKETGIFLAVGSGMLVAIYR